MTVMTDNAKLYRLMCEMAADAERRGLVRPVCNPGEVMVYDDFGNVVGKARRPDTADDPTVVDAPE